MSCRTNRAPDFPSWFLFCFAFSAFLPFYRAGPLSSNGPHPYSPWPVENHFAKRQNTLIGTYPGEGYYKAAPSPSKRGISGHLFEVAPGLPHRGCIERHRIPRARPSHKGCRRTLLIPGLLLVVNFIPFPTPCPPPRAQLPCFRLRDDGGILHPQRVWLAGMTTLFIHPGSTVFSCRGQS